MSVSVFLVIHIIGCDVDKMLQQGSGQFSKSFSKYAGSEEEQCNLRLQCYTTMLKSLSPEQKLIIVGKISSDVK